MSAIVGSAQCKEKAAAIARPPSLPEELHESCASLSRQAWELEELRVLAQAEGDSSFAAECTADLEELWCNGAQSLVEAALSTTVTTGCFLEVHSGEGGVDAMDWCDRLGKMYESWAAAQGCHAERVAEVSGEHAGCRSLTLHISGPKTAGLLVPEAGAHRLIRMSPFDRKNRRHTSFAAVLVFADGGLAREHRIVAPLKTELRVETMRSSGPGGQSVNVSDTAVRVTHLPTGISVKCQQVASQADNLKTAMKWLMAKLEARAEADRRRERAEVYAGGVLEASAAAERRVRTYTLHPRELVKDNRTGLTSTDVEAVLAGSALQPFLECGVLLRARMQYCGGAA